jgi:hypothetical protein
MRGMNIGAALVLVLVAAGVPACGSGDNPDVTVPIPLSVAAAYPGGGAMVDACSGHAQKVDFVLVAFTAAPNQAELATALELVKVNCDGVTGDAAGDVVAVTAQPYKAALKVAEWSIDDALEAGACYRLKVGAALHLASCADAGCTLGADYYDYFSTAPACE